MRPVAALLAEARWSLSAGLIELLDGQGLPHAEHLDQIRPLLACWTRCRALGRRWKRGCWTAKAEKQYGRLVLSALRLARRDGARVFSDAASGGSDAELLAAAADLTPRLGLAVRTRGGGRGMNLEVLRAKAAQASDALGMGGHGRDAARLVAVRAATGRSLSRRIVPHGIVLWQGCALVGAVGT